jgi:protein gp37
MRSRNYENGFRLTTHDHMLEVPLQWSKPRRIFVNSMSDLFHQDVPFAFIQKVLETIRKAHWHEFQILTKRAHRLADLSPLIDWPANLFVGVSVETDDFLFRIGHLLLSGAPRKFISLEPLLGPIPVLPLDEIDWVIVGGESGPDSRPMDPAWALDIRDQCAKANVPFMFKQWGGPDKKRAGRLLDGREYLALPNGTIFRNSPD